jgi:hypothetical protein
LETLPLGIRGKTISYAANVKEKEEKGKQELREKIKF